MGDSNASSDVDLDRAQSSVTSPNDDHAIVSPQVSHTDPIDAPNETVTLSELTTGIRDQNDLEREIGNQADQLLLRQANERDQKRLDKALKDKDRLVGQIKRLEEKLGQFGNHTTKNKYREEIRSYDVQIKTLEKDVEQIRSRLGERDHDKSQAEAAQTKNPSNQRMPGESQRDFLIRTGKITPFSKMGQALLQNSNSLGEVMLDAEEEEDGADGQEEATDSEAKAQSMSHRHLLAPGFEQDGGTPASSPKATESDAELARRLQDEEDANHRPAKRRRLQPRKQIKEDSPEDQDEEGSSDAAYEEEQAASDHEASDDENDLALDTEAPLKRKAKSQAKTSTVQENFSRIDDGDESVYQARLRDWVERRSAARKKAKESHPEEIKDEDAEDASDEGQDEHLEEWHLPHPTRPDAQFEGGFKMPGDIYPSLFDYQKTGVQWLWELFSQQVGGIVGDEMGLGKTIQIVSFLAGLHYSDKITKPIVVVCPATVMKQWVNEFHVWWPALRVSILHSSGSGMLDLSREARNEEDLEQQTYSSRSTQTKGFRAARRIVDKVKTDGHVLVTTYSGLQTYAELLIPTEWQYAVLDEGHTIRNPNTAITIYCKELRTHNRIILSGTPMQNNLTELWSLFDFVYPMRLGTLVNFRNQFEIPIKQGGYANASNLQVETAMKCAETLKEAISPYLLQRFKVDVAADLPQKSERVLFCKLTKLQRDAYEWFLNSEEMKSIAAGKRQPLYGVDILRKICNHPDLVDHKNLSKKTGYRYGDPSKSGKMQVVKALLQDWQARGHKTLLFAQHRIMLDILEDLLGRMPGFKFRRMDGNTAIRDRQALVDEFNKQPDIHVFLLTTKVGGLGVNLTGANRVIIYDPDWNPSTDVQARERAWRLGQKREVEIYRLMTAGTIEEKIYHRQIFKQFLTNKILKDPKQRQTFQLRDLHDLFTLTDTADGQTETGSIFRGTEVKLSDSKEATAGDQHLPTPPDDGKLPATSLDTIAGVSRHEKYQGDADEAQKESEAHESSAKDDRVLSSIFARAGVQSALEHDAIINGKKVVQADPEMVAREARRVAAEAARELKRAGEVARTIPAGVPTWTGQFGTAGRPEDTPSFRSSPGLSRGRGGSLAGRGGRGPSSASIIANLQSRGIGSTISTSSAHPSPRSSTPSRSRPRGKDFITMIRDFLQSRGGSATTQVLIDHFNPILAGEAGQGTLEFKEMLKQVAALDSGSGRGRTGRGKWVLKAEFRRPV